MHGGGGRSASFHSAMSSSPVAAQDGAGMHGMHGQGTPTTTRALQVFRFSFSFLVQITQETASFSRLPALARLFFYWTDCIPYSYGIERENQPNIVLQLLTAHSKTMFVRCRLRHVPNSGGGSTRQHSLKRIATPQRAQHAQRQLANQLPHQPRRRRCQPPPQPPALPAAPPPPRSRLYACTQARANGITRGCCCAPNVIFSTAKRLQKSINSKIS